MHRAASITAAMPEPHRRFTIIPGTYVFDGKHASGAYNLNKMLFSLNDEQNRADMQQDPAAFCERFGVDGEQRDALLNGQFLRLLQLGANVYYLAKYAVPAGISVQDAGAAFKGISTEEFKEQLLAHQQGMSEKLEKIGGYWRG